MKPYPSCPRTAGLDRRLLGQQRVWTESRAGTSAHAWAVRIPQWPGRSSASPAQAGVSSSKLKVQSSMFKVGSRAAGFRGDVDEPKL